MTDESASLDAQHALRHRGSRKRSRRTIVLIAGIAALVVAAAGVGTAFAINGQPQPQPPVAASPTPTTPADVALARTAMFRGAVEAWHLPPNAEIAAVLPAAGSAHSGAVSLAIDAPAVRQPTDAAVIAVAVEPGATYQVSVWVRLQAEQLAAIPASLVVGDTVIPASDGNAEWQRIEGEVTVPADVTTINASLRIDGSITGLAFDDVLVQKEGGPNLVANPSFEAVQAAAVIANDSLVMSTEIASIAVAVPEGPVTWQLADGAGAVTASGSVDGAGPVTAIPLDGAAQGHQTLTVTDATGAAVQTPIALIDTNGAAVPLDARFGVTAQFDRPQHADGGRLAAALGYGELHADVLWSRNEKSKGEYAWDEAYLTEFSKVRANGLSTIGVIAYGNKLYDGGQFPSSPEALDAFGRYAASAAQSLSLSAVEVFNEPNKDRFNKGSCGTSASCYIPLLDSVRNHFTAQGLTLPIIGGATALYDQAWFTEFWQAGGMDHLDVVSFHPYEGWIDRNPDLMRPTIAQSIADMQQYAGGTRPIWITEMGFTTMTGGVSLDQQRDWLIRSEVLALAGGAEKYMWYDIVDDASDPANGEGNFGLYEHAPRAGVAVVAPKSSAFAQALVIAQLGGRAFAADESDDATNVVAFGEADDTVRIAWAVGEKADRVFASTEPVTVVGTSGATTTVKPVDGKITLTLTGTPVFISGFEG